MKTRKDMQLEYKERKVKIGIFQIINKNNNKICLRSSFDLEKGFNSDIFQLNAGVHPNKELQNDWKLLGENMFEFKIFDELKVSDDLSNNEIRKELKEFLDLHTSELKESGELLY
jgi:hypothetical protein